MLILINSILLAAFLVGVPSVEESDKKKNMTTCACKDCKCSKEGRSESCQCGPECGCHSSSCAESGKKEMRESGR